MQIIKDKKFKNTNENRITNFTLWHLIFSEKIQTLFVIDFLQNKILKIKLKVLQVLKLIYTQFLENLSKIIHT